MSKFRVEGETIEDIREELNVILKRLTRDVDNLKGYSGDVIKEGREVHSDDILIKGAAKGLVLSDNGSPGQLWRLWIDGTGTISTETYKYTPKD